MAKSYDDYSLVGKQAVLAVENGLAEAVWYTPTVPKDRMGQLLQRRNWPAARDTLVWFALIIGSGWIGYLLWRNSSWWAIAPFAVYGVLYSTTSDSRWHESGHGTAFKTDRLNDALYEIASFMTMREATVWRWSHTRHHSDTLIVGRDPEVEVKTPLRIVRLIFDELFKMEVIPKYFRHLLLHTAGRLTPEEKVFIPPSEYSKVFLRAPIYLSVYAAVIGLAVYLRSVLPLLYIGLPGIYGSWLLPMYAWTQHAGLAENVLDHRLNCRTVHMNLINRYFYWNMNYHVEHHMFPLVPYHQLPKLHELVKADMPTPYSSVWNAWREIVPAILRQLVDPGFCVKRELPAPVPRSAAQQPRIFRAKEQPQDGWFDVCESGLLQREDVIRFDHGRKTYAIYRTAVGSLYATDGLCTHAGAHLAGGLVMGNLIECPKHNGRFDITDGSPQRLPACKALNTHAVRERDGKIFLLVEPGAVPR